MKLFTFLFLLPLQIFAQDITGLWSGYLYNDTTRKYLPYELTISEDKDRSNGYSHAVILVDSIENIAIKKVQIRKRNGKILVEDEAFIYNNFTESPPKGVKVFSNMIYSDEDSAFVLRGDWNTNRTKEYNSLTGSIRLQKQKDFTRSKLIAKLQELDLSNALSFLPAKKEEAVLAGVADPDQAKIAEPVSEKNEIEDIAVPLKVSSPDLLPKLKEVALISSTTSIPKSKSLPLPKEKETPIVIASSPETIKKLPPVPQPKPKEKQIVIIPPPPIIKKQPPVSQARPPEKKEVVTSLPPPLPKPILVAAPVASAIDLATRTTETIKSVLFKSDSLVLSLYDNGEIDGDTVSVVMNGLVIIASQRLTANAITKTIYITPELGDSLQLIMYAENLGSIAPNTGLLILQDGDDRYEIRFAGDFKKNSAIILRRKPKNQ